MAFSSIISCKKEDTSSPDTSGGDNRNRYTGEWLCNENGGTTFTINITKTGVADTLLIDNFSGYGSSAPLAMAVVTGNSMTIPLQNITLTAIHISGSGVLNTTGTKITMNYIADGNAITATCSH